MDRLVVENAGHPPAPAPRRPRVREVSSRFMSPVAGDSFATRSSPRVSTPTAESRQRSSSVNRSRRQLDLDSFLCSDENRPTRPESPLPPDQARKPRPNVKPFRENHCPGKGSNGFATPSRPDTPTATATATAMRIRLLQQRPCATAAAKLLQSSAEPNTPSEASHNLRCLPDIRSSMPEADMLPTRQMTEKRANTEFSKISRSLNSDHLLGTFSKPPVPPCATAKPASEIRKGKKVEDAHSLRLLQNRYLQWRYANASAEASMLAHQRQTERTHYSLASKITELYDSVKRKRIELDVLQRTKTLSTILEAQIPYLDQWFSLQEDYSYSLAEATQALLNASLRLPISANVKANKQEVQEALNSAMEVMEKIVFHVQQSMPKAEETDHLISELARVIGGERALVEECGNLLSKTYTTQVEECSLRGHIIQLKQHC